MTLPRKSISAFLLLLLGHFPLSALVEETIDPKSAIEITLSTTAPNRIMFEEGSIVDVILDETKFQSFLHQKTGQAFLTPFKEIKEFPTSITVMTSSGDTQTFSVFAEEKPGEIIILKDKESSASKKSELSSDYHSQTVDFLNTLLWGNIPHGYGVRALQNETFPIERPFEATSLRLLEGPFEEILVIEIQKELKLSILPTLKGKKTFGFFSLKPICTLGRKP